MRKVFSFFGSIHIVVNERRNCTQGENNVTCNCNLFAGGRSRTDVE